MAECLFHMLGRYKNPSRIWFWWDMELVQTSQPGQNPHCSPEAKLWLEVILFHLSNLEFIKMYRYLSSLRCKLKCMQVYELILNFYLISILKCLLPIGHTLRFPLKLEGRSPTMFLVSWMEMDPSVLNIYSLTVYHRELGSYNVFTEETTERNHHRFSALDPCSHYLVCVETADSHSFTCLSAITGKANISRKHSSGLQLTVKCLHSEKLRSYLGFILRTKGVFRYVDIQSKSDEWIEAALWFSTNRGLMYWKLLWESWWCKGQKDHHWEELEWQSVGGFRFMWESYWPGTRCVFQLEFIMDGLWAPPCLVLMNTDV